MKVLLSLLCICAVFTAGCATAPRRTLGPKPDSPEVYMNVHIDSIPSGVDVYEADEDGMLRGKIGVTPLNLKVGFATKYWSDGSRCYRYTYKWSNGAIKWSKTPGSSDIYLNIGLVKDNQTIKIVTQKHLGNAATSFPPKDVSITVPVVGSYGSGSYSGSERPTGHSSAYCEQKRREYEAALSEYNQVLKKYNDAKAMGFITDMNWANQQSSQPGFDKGMAFLGMIGGTMSKNDAESAVEVARQRLNAAKAQLCD